MPLQVNDMRNGSLAYGISYHHRILETIGESLSDIMIAFDNSYMINYMNDKALQTLKYNREDLLGCHISELFPKSQQETVQVLQQEALENRPVQERRTCLRVKGRKQLPVSASLALLISGNYESGFIMIAKDNQHLIQVTEALKQKNKELETLIYKISHDLKGPLASINGIFQLMDLQNNTAEDQQNYLDLIRKSTKKLENKVVGLLELGLSERDNLQFKPLSIKEKIEEIISEFDQFPGREEVFFHITATDGLMVDTEEQLFHSIMQNLIENSIKYRKVNTDDSVTKISARKYKDGIKIKVKDNGLGMDRDLQNRVFDMFYRGHNHTEGSGLGMFIVKTHVEKLGGEIGIKSSPQLGTEVWLYLPQQNTRDTKIRKLLVH